MPDAPVNLDDHPAILLLAAIGQELAPAIRSLRLRAEGERHVGRFEHCRIIAAVTGIGAARAASSFNQLVATHQPCAAINLGFAGGLDPHHHAGDVLHIQCVLNAHGLAAHFRENVPFITSDDHRREPGHTLLTVDHLVDSVAAKRALHERFRADAVDMESFALAHAAADRQLPLILLRAISDDADTALPAASLHWVTPAGRADAKAAAAYALRHPQAIPALLRLHRHTRRAARALAQHLPRHLADLHAKYTTPR